MSNIAIQDANVIIDLVNGEVLEIVVSGLNFSFVVTDMVLGEILQPEEARPQMDRLIENQNISVVTFSGDQIFSMYGLQTKYPGLSIEDSSCLFYGKEAEAIILTGDMRLRKAAKKESVPVIGTLGILDMLLEKSVLGRALCIEALVKIMASNNRLPQKECIRRLAEWKESA